MPLVLLPGTLCDGRIFDPLVQLLPGVHTQVIECSHATSMRRAAEHVLLHAPPRFALLGFSLGGMVAMEVTLLAAERVRGVALIGTSPLPVPLHRHAARRAAVQEAGTMAIEAFVRARLWPDYCNHREQDHPSRMLIETMATSLGHSTFGRQTEMALQRPDYRPMLHAVRCPTLVVAGTEDRLCPPEVQQALHAALPNCALHMIPGSGHLALVEKPGEVAAAVAAWVHTVLQAQESSPAAVAQENE